MCRSNNIIADSDNISLKLLSDNELINIIRFDGMNQSGRSAVNIMVSRYLGLIRKKAYSFSCNYADTEDLSQEGLMALLKAVSTFKPELNTKFSSYADVCISNRLKSTLSKLSSIPDASLLDEMDISTDVSPESIFVEKEFTENLYREISLLLSEKEWSIFRLYLENLSYSDIADRLSITEKAVDNAVFRVRRKLKTFLSPAHFHR